MNFPSLTVTKLDGTVEFVVVVGVGVDDAGLHAKVKSMPMIARRGMIFLFMFAEQVYIVSGKIIV
jgi:hypothetical protein